MDSICLDTIVINLKQIAHTSAERVRHIQEKVESGVSALLHTINSLKEDKKKLQTALKDTLKKKNELYNEAQSLYKKMNEKPSLHLRQLEDSQRLMSDLKEGLIKRDQIINGLKLKIKKEKTKRVDFSQSVIGIIDKNQEIFNAKSIFQLKSKISQSSLTGVYFLIQEFIDMATQKEPKVKMNRQERHSKSLSSTDERNTDAKHDSSCFQNYSSEDKSFISSRLKTSSLNSRQPCQSIDNPTKSQKVLRVRFNLNH